MPLERTMPPCDNGRHAYARLCASRWRRQRPAPGALDVVVLYLAGESREAFRHEIEEEIRRAAEADRWLRKQPPTVEWSPPDFPVEGRPADLDAAHPAVQTLAEPDDVLACARALAVVPVRRCGAAREEERHVV